MKTMAYVFVVLSVTSSLVYGMEEVIVKATTPVENQEVVERNPFKRLAKNVRTRALFFGVKTESPALVAWCLKAGVHVNRQDATGSTPLHYAAYYLNFDILKAFLVVKNINPTLYNNAGYTPIGIAHEQFEALTQKRTQIIKEKAYDDFKLIVRRDHGSDLADGELRQLFNTIYKTDLEVHIKAKETQELIEFDLFLNCFAQLDSAQFPYEPEEQVELNAARERIFALETVRQMQYAWGKEALEQKCQAVTFPNK